MEGREKAKTIVPDDFGDKTVCTLSIGRNEPNPALRFVEITSRLTRPSLSGSSRVHRAFAGEGDERAEHAENATPRAELCRPSRRRNHWEHVFPPLHAWWIAVT